MATESVEMSMDMTMDMTRIIEMIEEQSWSSDVDFSNSEYGGSRASLAASLLSSPIKSTRSSPLRTVKEALEMPPAPDLLDAHGLLEVNSLTGSDDVSTSTPDASQSSSNATERPRWKSEG